MTTAQIIARHSAGENPDEIAQALGLPVEDVRAVLRRAKRRRRGARMKAEWEPPLRPHTKMLEPEAQN